MFFNVLLVIIIMCIDDIFVGLSLGAHEKFKSKYLLVIAGSVFTVSIIAFFTAEVLAEHMDFNSGIIIGFLFILMGIKDIFEHKHEQHIQSAWQKVLMLTFILAVDCFFTTITITLEEAKAFFIPIMVSVTILAFVALGNYIVKYIKLKTRSQNIIAGICLILVGILLVIGIL